jgi:hypothetical protein
MKVIKRRLCLAIIPVLMAASLNEEAVTTPGSETLLKSSASNESLSPGWIPHGAIKQLSQIAVSEWMTYYYLNPQPELLPGAIASFSESGTLTLDTAIPPLISFFSFIFRDNPESLAEWFQEISQLSEPEQVVLFEALWFANTPAAREQLSELLAEVSLENAELIRDLLSLEPTPIQELAIDATTPIKSSSVLDMLWAAFMATGEERYVVRIISVLPWSEVAPEHDLGKFTVGHAARWSLTSNAVQHEKIMTICLEQLSQQPVEIVEILEEVINEAQSQLESAPERSKFIQRPEVKPRSFLTKPK